MLKVSKAAEPYTRGSSTPVLCRISTKRDIN
nr:MAG TPA: hypothetical protein [Caudoviricetes sp.]